MVRVRTTHKMNMEECMRRVVVPTTKVGAKWLPLSFLGSTRVQVIRSYPHECRVQTEVPGKRNGVSTFTETQRHEEEKEMDTG